MVGRGLFFGLGDNVERLPGKRAAGLLDGPVYNIFPFGDIALVQTVDALWRVPISEISGFIVTFAPFTPSAPVLSSVSYFSMTVTMPVLPAHATSLTLERSTNGLTWSVISTGLAGLQVISQTGLSDFTTYFYRAIAVNIYGSTAGPAASETTPARYPDAPTAPTYGTRTTSSLDVIVPALPAYAVTIDLQFSLDDASWTDVVVGATPGSTHTESGLADDTVYYFRARGLNVHGYTAGPSSNRATLAIIPSGTILDSSGDGVTDSSGNYIEEN